MKALYSPFLKIACSLIIFLSLFSCEKEENETEQQYELTVNSGSGSGSYSWGTVVDITANEETGGQIFNSWTGQVDNIGNVEARKTTIQMPPRDIEITATYVSLGEVAVINIDNTIEFQTMDGFGFFGGRDTWWSSPNSSHFYSDAWLEKIIAELGLTIWRNEVYPHNPPSENNTQNQDASWEKQKPMIQALQAKAEEHNVDLKIILTAWSAPGEFKWNASNYTWAGDENAERGPGPEGDYWPERDGGTLNPNKYEEYAQWWIDVIQMYKDVGVPVFAISLQNEPAFWQTTFNSTFYTTYWYAEMINAVIPIIKASHPDVLAYGSENMLSTEGKDINYPHFYHNKLKTDPTAMEYMDILAVHGYQDGIIASSGSELAQYWTNHREQFTEPFNKKAWMTETSGYVDTWEGDGDTSGAFGLAVDIQTAINFGDVSAWVWWQGSDLDGIDNYSLMSDLNVGKKYHISRNFYRFIRPGADRVKGDSTDEEITVSAFKHPTNDTHTIVLINTAEQSKAIKISMNGGQLPSEYEMIVTSENKNSESAGIMPVNQSILLPARSVVTLHAGTDILSSE